MVNYDSSSSCKIGWVAQGLEHSFHKREVVGPIPTPATVSDTAGLVYEYSTRKNSHPDT
jgi:hypothetical protein